MNNSKELFIHPFNKLINPYRIVTGNCHIFPACPTLTLIPQLQFGEKCKHKNDCRYFIIHSFSFNHTLLD